MTTEETSRPGYSKMKSWADHCSSEEEDSDDEHHPSRLNANKTESFDADLSFDESIEHISVNGDDGEIEGLEDIGGGRHYQNRGGRGGRGRGRDNHNQEEIPYPQDINFDDVPPNFPTQAPYTAHVRNLCFKIENPSDLADKIEGLTRWRYQKKQTVTVTNARVGVDRNTGQRKGFGYVEFDTPEELMIFLNLNDGFSRLNGRTLAIAIANNQRGGPRHNNHRNNSHNNNNMNRNISSEIDGSNFRGGHYSKRNSSNSMDNGSGNAPAERRSLKLAPRSKPVGDGRSSSQSGIFGAAKPRDGGSWRRKNSGDENASAAKEDSQDAASTTASDNGASNVTASQGGDRNAGRGGRGGRGRGGERRQNSGRGGRGGRGAGRGGGRRDNNSRKNDRRNGKDSDGWGTAEGGVAAKPAMNMPVVEKEATKKVTKVSNAFAALGFDSDSD